MSRLYHDFIDKAHALSKEKQPFVTVTLVKCEGHVPQNIGAKAIVTKDGLTWGTVGGGNLEARAINHAINMLSDGNRATEEIRYNLQKELNMVCGGYATLLYEKASLKRWTIALFGAGHVMQATIPILTTLDCELLCYDTRSEWLEKIPNHPRLQKHRVEELPKAVEKVPAGSFYVVITQGYHTDLPVIKKILQRGKAPFLGVIGSVPKAVKLKNKLLEEGINKELVDTIKCPIGMAIGCNAPEEIAISIAAELLQKRDEIEKTQPKELSRREILH